MTDRTLSHQLAEFAASVTFETLPPPVVSSVKDRILDTIGICLAAAAEGLADGVIALAEAWGGREEAGIVGRAGRFPAPVAAQVNGTLAHSLDFDDTHLPSILHPSASIVPATLALAEAVGASGRDAIAAAAVGIEVCVRIGMGGQLPEGNVWFDRGWHTTAICGTMGAAALGAKLLGLGVDGIRNALGIAASFASGVIEANRTGGSVKRLHCGWAAHSGLLAAFLAKAGYTGPPTVLEGRFGLYNAFIDARFDPANVVGGLGEEWSIPKIFYKPYPANHYTHGGIDAAIAIRRKYGPLDPDQVERIELGVAGPTLRTIGQPREEKIRPQSGYHAQFSGPFTVATALLGGSGLGVSFDDFTDEKARDPRVLALAAKVEPYADPEADAIYPYQFPAIVRVHFRDGRVVEERVMANRGGPDNPLSPEELRLKFMINATRLVTAERAEQLAEAILALDERGLPVDIVALARPAI
ncbi:MAG: MmgE/PrpD family protein [Chloroflexota bacterium]|nr:MmgE/PrpD family protein [Dehalococcoidia bacterium]MDW8253916.1 MmgE/PrpD family protein [Chloroflexota bacterium]